MTTIDVWRNSNGELTLVMTGVTTAPTIVDQGTGASVTLEPAVLDHNAFSVTVVSALGRPNNAWMGTLPLAPDATEAHLSIDVDGQHQQGVVRWPTVESTLFVH
jgi:hypothetical protein